VKEGIHPKYQANKFTCSCGQVIETSATIGDKHIEICDACHPFYTGKSKLVDTAGRIDRFNARYAAKAAPAPAAKTAAPVAKTAAPAVKVAAKK